jgi:hypothetical protein
MAKLAGEGMGPETSGAEARYRNKASNAAPKRLRHLKSQIPAKG